MEACFTHWVGCRSIALQSGTEPAFTGQTTNGYSHDNKAAGLYVSAVGGLPLFSSETKFESGTGWPSFFAPVDPEHVIEVSLCGCLDGHVLHSSAFANVRKIKSLKHLPMSLVIQLEKSRTVAE